MDLGTISPIRYSRQEASQEARLRRRSFSNRLPRYLRRADEKKKYHPLERYVLISQNIVRGSATWLKVVIPPFVRRHWKSSLSQKLSSAASLGDAH
jgi:hypothetical protein